MKEFFRGFSRALGVGIGYLPIAMSFGTVSIQSGISEVASMGMSLWQRFFKEQISLRRSNL